VNAVLELIGATIESRRVALPKEPLTIAFALLDGGTFVVDTSRSPPVQPGWAPDAQAAILSNTRTMLDIAEGRFDPKKASNEHFLVWEGDERALERLAELLGGQSILSLRAKDARSSKAAAKKKRRRPKR
jgi:hypothetical protein